MAHDNYGRMTNRTQSQTDINLSNLAALLFIGRRMCVYRPRLAVYSCYVPVTPLLCQLHH